MERRPDTSSIDYKIQKGILQPGEYKQAYMNLKPKDSTTAGHIRHAAAKIMHRKHDYEAICSILKTGYRSELARLNAQNRDKKAAKPLDLLDFLEPLNDPFNMEKEFTAEEAKKKRMMDMFGLTGSKYAGTRIMNKCRGT